MMKKNEKIVFVAQLKELANSHRSLGIINMKNVPAALFQKAKKDLAGKATVKMSRKKLISRALNESGKNGMDKLEKTIQGSVSLVFSNDNAFELFKKLKTARVKAPAKEGDVVKNDIIIQKGLTQISPGPAISTLQKVGIKTQVQGGKLAVMNDIVVLKTGGVVTADIVTALNLLGIMPNEKRLNLSAVWEDGIIYGMDVLDIDIERFIKELQACVHFSINFSLNTGFITKESAPLAVQKAFLEAQTLALEANILTKDTAVLLISRAARTATNIEKMMPKPAEEQKQETVS
ncbi:MAG: 50S ribosomal protein L10 [Candidatus Aenigmarchaeota archaeon]|nr:50S ribosomal protein L10 [Candidatus Aenigmarchaeota archaeon]